MNGPLASLKILDFSTLLPGPFASLLLADMGAQVLRVESPTRMDLVRVLPPHVDGTSASHAYLNRNKRCIALDLKQAEAVEVVKQLVQEYDIVLEQFRPGVMDKLGVGYEALKAINPKLIYVSITGYGQTGPLRDRAGHDINYLALAGVASYTGRRETGPLPLGVQLADIGGGSLHGVMGLLAAVIHRQQTGEGQQVDVSMTDCAFSLHGMAGAGYLAAGVEPEMEGLALNGGSFYDYYRTRDGRWFSVGSLEPQFMQQFCAAIGRPELAARGCRPNRKSSSRSSAKSPSSSRSRTSLTGRSALPRWTPVSSRCCPWPRRWNIRSCVNGVWSRRCPTARAGRNGRRPARSVSPPACPSHAISALRWERTRCR